MLNGKVALITGAARGIGKTIALELAANGAKIAINDFKLVKEANETVEEIKKLGSDAKAYIADVSQKDQVAQMVSDIEKDFGKIDILINNAGISPKHNGVKKCVFEMDPEEWDKVMQVNLNSAFYTIRYAAPIMMKIGGGRIVNIASMAARLYSPIPGAHYCASKTGIIGLTRVCAGELAPYNIIVNAIAPGRIESEMTSAAGEEANKKILSTIPIGRYGTQQDVAKLIKFLVSDENNYIVGATIDINGGRAIL